MNTWRCEKHNSGFHAFGSCLLCEKERREKGPRALSLQARPDIFDATYEPVDIPQPDNEGTGATPSSPGKIEKDSPVWRGIVGLSRRK